MNNQNQIENEAALQEIIGECSESASLKVMSTLDAPMTEFIQLSTLIFVSTIEKNGRIDVSPKGDPAGFVIVENKSTLLIPERSGNRLTYGFKNLLNNDQIGLILLVAKQKETLRIRGRASLHTDPEILQQMAVKGRPALLYTRVEIDECFFHCGKALVRSNIWKPQQDEGSDTSLGAKHFSDLMQSDYGQVKNELDAYYQKD